LNHQVQDDIFSFMNYLILMVQIFCILIKISAGSGSGIRISIAERDPGDLESAFLLRIRIQGSHFNVNPDKDPLHCLKFRILLEILLLFADG